MPILFQLLISLVFMVLAVLLRPKPKQPKAQDIQPPTADAGKPIPVVFGSTQIMSVNCLYFGGAWHNERSANVGKKG
jgi:hypothetical protein